MFYHFFLLDVLPVLISMFLPLHAGRLQTVNLRGNSKRTNMINKHVAFARTDIIIRIYSSPRLHVLLHFGKSRARLPCYIDQLSALCPRLTTSPPPRRGTEISTWTRDTISLPGRECNLTGVFFGDSYL